MRNNHLTFSAVIAAFSVFSCSSGGNSHPYALIEAGSSRDALYSALKNEVPFAISCDRVTYFPGDEQFDDCKSRGEYIIIYRESPYQYAYTVSGDRVTNVETSNFTVTYP